jgi:hypothetical protein
MDRVGPPHTGLTRRGHEGPAVAARLGAYTRRTIVVRAGGLGYESYGGLVVVGMAVEQVDGRPWCSCRSARI